MSRLIPTFVCMASLFTLACESSGEEQIFDLDERSTVEGRVFVDANASGRPEAADLPASNVRVALVVANASDTIARINTLADGSFRFSDVPVGMYEVVVTNFSLGDSMSVVYRDPPGEPVVDIDPSDSTAITVASGDTATVEIGIAYPIFSVEEARELPPGRRIFVRAVALNAVGAAGDTSLFLQGSSAAIRATRVAVDVSVEAGDSLFALGTTAVRSGQPVLNGVTAGVEEGGIGIDTLVVTAARARTAAGGRYDAQLVHVSDVAITDTTRAGTVFLVTAEDPSGTVQIALQIAGAYDLTAFAPGDELSVTGILVPRAGVAGEWRIHTRSPEDLVER